jgi:cysteine-rich repeat protein
MCKEICGDGKDFGHYGCDDGNNIDGDGCDADCRIERGYTCAGGTCTLPYAPDVCIEICGDGHDFRK